MRDRSTIKRFVMKNYLLVFAVLGMGLGVAAQAPTGFSLQGIGSAVVPATMGKMTNLIFPAAIQTAVKVSRDILVQRVRGVTNVIELKAVRAGFGETNLTVCGRDGEVYSFVVRFSSDESVLNFRVVAGVGGGLSAALAPGLAAALSARSSAGALSSWLVCR
jgi:uncharacterized protein DUF4138